MPTMRTARRSRPAPSNKPVSLQSTVPAVFPTNPDAIAKGFESSGCLIKNPRHVVTINNPFTSASQSVYVGKPRVTIDLFCRGCRRSAEEKMEPENITPGSDEQDAGEERFVHWLRYAIRAAVRVLAALMIVVIWLGVGDVIYIMHMRMMAHPYHLIDISDILATFGAFMAVLIAIEIFINVVSYLREQIVHLETVIATAYMAILRKVIVLDYKEMSAEYVYATAAVVFALSIGFWLTVISRRSKKPE